MKQTSLVATHLDYCNCLLAGARAYQGDLKSTSYAECCCLSAV